MHPCPRPILAQLSSSAPGTSRLPSARLWTVWHQLGPGTAHLMRQMASQSREVCRQYARTGTCRYGDHCRYAHQQYEGPSASGNAYGGPSQPSTSGYSSDRNRGYAQPRYPSQQPHYGSRPQTYGDGRNSTAYDTGGGYRGHNNNSGYNSGYQSQSHHQRYTQPSYGQAPYGRYQQGGGYSSDGRLHLPDLTPDWKDRQWLGCKVRYMCFSTCVYCKQQYDARCWRHRQAFAGVQLWLVTCLCVRHGSVCVCRQRPWTQRVRCLSVS